ncbi:MAG: UDP-glucose 4-epimerase GalE [Lentisphaerae bacterium RIFOXYB12_FULL_65_16]|nr:MAG: UDP-glucose 4-epimerase GalE [Lentisphaerae bacterium RIFOXYA12_64_32]OGV86453.1 MAG: UDP-glucose 4-epimerase GalE [Lentisphaerae bacterium RIFOXYB12_FULL_65_16]
MKILVTGGAGYIGSCCTEYLLDHGHNVIIYDSLLRGHRDAVDPRAVFVHGELADAEKVCATLAQHRVDGIIHFAGFIEVGESMVDPGRFFRNNVACGLNLMKGAAETQVRRIVFSSTAATYGMPEKVPITEDQPTLPVNPYGESKLMFERILRWYHQIHGLEYVALRYFNASGATPNFGEDHNPETHLIPLVLQVAAGRREHVKVYGTDYPTPDGTCIRDYVHVLDLAQAHLLALESPEVGSFNVGSGSGYSVHEIVRMAEQVTGRSIDARPAPRRPGDPPRLISDSTAARTRLGWRPQHDSIRDIIESAWSWRQRHPDGYAK